MDCLDHWNKIVNRGAMEVLLSCGETIESTPMELRPTVASAMVSLMVKAGQVESRSHGYWVLAESYAEVVMRKQLEWFTSLLNEIQSMSDKMYTGKRIVKKSTRSTRKDTASNQLQLFRIGP